MRLSIALILLSLVFIASTEGWLISHAKKAAKWTAEALSKAKQLALHLYAGRKIIFKYRTLARDLDHAIGNYGKWCGRTRTRYNKGPCRCGLSRRNIAACRAYAYTRPYDRVDGSCMLHDLCVHCNKPRVAVPGINFALYKHNTNIHWCHCEKAIVRNAARAGTCKKTGSSGCTALKRSISIFFPNYPCACKVRTYNCWYISGFRKKNTKCDSKIVANYKHC